MTALPFGICALCSELRDNLNCGLQTWKYILKWKLIKCGKLIKDNGEQKSECQLCQTRLSYKSNTKAPFTEWIPSLLITTIHPCQFCTNLTTNNCQIIPAFIDFEEIFHVGYSKR